LRRPAGPIPTAGAAKKLLSPLERLQGHAGQHSPPKAAGVGSLPESSLVPPSGAEKRTSSSTDALRTYKGKPPTGVVADARVELRDRLCQYCGQPLPDNLKPAEAAEGCQAVGTALCRQASDTAQASPTSDLLLRLEAAGIGPWQIKELKDSEAKLVEIAAKALHK